MHRHLTSGKVKYRVPVFVAGNVKFGLKDLSTPPERAHFELLNVTFHLKLNPPNSCKVKSQILAD